MTMVGRGASRRWLLHRAQVLRGDWHIHTQLSSGYSSLHDCCRAAVERGLQVVAITERVDSMTDGGFRTVEKAVDAARREFPELAILLGCEVDVRNADGDLAVGDEVLARCDVVLAGVHDLSEPDRYVTALLNMLSNPQVDVWAHPTLYAHRHGIALDTAAVERILDRCRDRAVLLELNARHQLPAGDFLELVKQSGVTVVWGSDAHHAHEVGRRWTGSRAPAVNAPAAGEELSW
jgi:histidinol phosphatase-like PHP family hydrolase